VLLPPPRFGVVISGRALLCALGMLVWTPAGGVWAEPDPASVIVTAQADPPAEEDLVEPSGGGYVAPPSDVEVIRIKGRSVEAIQTDVPESVTQFDAAEIEALGAQNISDLAKVTPNVEIKTAGATAPTFFIRGVGLSDFAANAAGAVAIYQDDVAINAAAMQLGLLYDIQDVEIIRGPKGYGSTRNDAAGAIKMYSRKPTGELTAGLRSSVGKYNLRDFEGHIEAPLVDEVLSTRLAFRLIERDGYAWNRCADGPASSLNYQGLNPDHLSTSPGFDAESKLRNLPSREGYRGYVGSNLITPQGEEYVGVRVWDSYSIAPPGQPRVPPPGGSYESYTSWSVPPPRGNPYVPPFYPLDAPAVKYNGVGFCGETQSRRPEYVQDYFQLADHGTAAVINRPGTARMTLSELPAGLAEDMNNIGSWAARGQLRYTPRDADMDWILKLHGSRLDQLSTVGQSVGTKGQGSAFYYGGLDAQNYRDRDITAMDAALRAEGYPIYNSELSNQLANNLDSHPWWGDYNRTGPTTLDVWGVSLRGDWDLGSASLRSVSAYDTYERYRDQDTDFTPNVLFESVGSDGAWQFFQEVELAGELEDTPLRWNVGGYYLMENLSFESKTITRVLSAQATREYEQDTTSFALYAGFGWDFLDDFTLEGGVRYQWNRAGLDFELFAVGAVPPPFAGEEVWQAPTGGLALKYRFTEDATMYWKYTRGWKPGTWNTSTNVQRGANAADPVTIDAWEAGLRGRWFDGRFAMGAAAFYYRYVDYQVFVVLSEPGTAPTLSVLNANDAEVYGAEVDIRLEPLVGWAPSFLDGLVLSARAGWLQTEFLKFTNDIIVYKSFFTGGITLVTVDYAGNPVINAPRFKVSGNAEWTFDFGRFGSITPRYDFAWSDAIAFGPNNSYGTPNLVGDTFLPQHTIGQRAFWLHNLRLTYRTPGGNTEISAWVRNLDNFAYKTYAFDASTFQNVTIAFVGEPRMFGLDITFNW